MVPNRRQPGYWVCIAGDILFVPALYGIYGLVVDPFIVKGHAYEKTNKFTVTGKLTEKKDEDKYINLTNIGADIKNLDEVKVYNVAMGTSNASAKLDKLMAQAEAKSDKAEAKKKLKKKETEKLKQEEEAIKFDDTKFSENIFKTMKTSGFVDTVNKVFRDDNNTLFLEGKITKLNFYRFHKSNSYLYNYYKAKVFLTWYFKNQYGEKLDSINTTELSGDFVLSEYSYTASTAKTDEAKQVEKMIGDAIDNSYLNLFKNGTAQKYFAAQPLPTAFGEPVLYLRKPTSVVQTKGDAASASVIIKRTKDKGHGSGFAITQDGYILTNYHVIASEDPNKTAEIKVITNTGEELGATVVRVNKTRDIALLKVNKPFERAFVLSNTRQFGDLHDVYTVGAPKSIELGQTVTPGIISNERKSNNNELLQLSMPLNFGNSGGPIFDNTGALHGVVVSKLTGYSTEGIGFAVPAYKVSEYINISY